jgi:hypothetical protein
MLLVYGPRSDVQFIRATADEAWTNRLRCGVRCKGRRMPPIALEYQRTMLGCFPTACSLGLAIVAELCVFVLFWRRVLYESVCV